jgi:hypothetical protein
MNNSKRETQMTKPLSQYISLKRRYSRSINLERDIENLEALEGYIPTERSLNALRRIINGIQSSEGNRAWTVTEKMGLKPRRERRLFLFQFVNPFFNHLGHRLFFLFSNPPEFLQP